MGIGIFDGDKLGEMLLKQNSGCSECGHLITYETSLNFAKSKGITDNVVMCSNCMSVFTVQLVPGRMTLTRNVTSRYFSKQEIALMREEIKELRTNIKKRYNVKRLKKDLYIALFCTICSLVFVVGIIYSRLHGNDTAAIGIIVTMTFFFMGCLIWSIIIIKKIRNKNR